MGTGTEIAGQASRGRRAEAAAGDGTTSAFPQADDDGMPDDLGRQWRSLTARALDLPAVMRDPLGDVIRTFGEELGFGVHLSDPGDARRQCIRVSALFESMCAYRGIPARSVEGLCFTRAVPSLALPSGQQEEPWAGHTAVSVAGAFAGQDSDIVIDWTARQFGAAPVPLVVTLTDWRSFWRGPAAAPGSAAKTRITPG